ncbi:MAG: hypothetical protein E3K37_08625 [Candidatus Kuenenia sp.]|nr:hypothetical protein [Candidatus Kuenenia hertensis]
MYKNFIIVIGFLFTMAIPNMFFDISHSMVYAHGHKHHGCHNCGHYICPGDCGKCEECIARRRAAKEESEKCEKCNHVDCPGDCTKCADCLNERIKKLEDELRREKEKN